MNKTITRKIPGGKLVHLEVSFDKQVDSVKITGDFFLHPEETMDAIIQGFRNLPLPVDQAGLSRELNRIMEQYQAQLIGVSIQDLVSMLEEAVA